jgi:hypothetical protein
MAPATAGAILFGARPGGSSPGGATEIGEPTSDPLYFRAPPYCRSSIKPISGGRHLAPYMVSHPPQQRQRPNPFEIYLRVQSVG